MPELKTYPCENAACDRLTTGRWCCGACFANHRRTQGHDLPHWPACDRRAQLTAP